MKEHLVIGTRGSRLALKQTEMVVKALSLAFPGLNCSVRVISTRGDRDLEMSLSGQLTKGLFTQEIEAELLDGRIDMAVHSLKDLPVECSQGICIGAYLKRAPVQEAWIGPAPLERMPAGSIIGTSSPRRIAQLQRAYPSLHTKPIRGNVETRIAKLHAGEFDGILMACAGMLRLGLEDQITERIPTSTIVPAPGQAAIAVHRRENDLETDLLLSAINHQDTEREVVTERTILSALGGGCAIPLGCYCHYSGQDKRYTVQAFHAGSNGAEAVYLEECFSEDDYEQSIRQIVRKLKREATL